MLNPNNDRLDYGQILSAPDGYRLDFAVGTTYSLDLDALTGASLALGLSEETDSELMKNPICLLEALRATGDKIALFCEGGQIHLPNKVTSLYILLEKMVYQINEVKKKGVKGYPSFHPKFWLLRFVNNKDVLYRVAVLSRNLTFDRSWDVSFYMDGQRSGASTSKNAPLQDFIEFLVHSLGKDELFAVKAKKMKSISRELSQVVFDTGSREFSDYDFLPTGIKKSNGGYHSITDTLLFRGFPNSGQTDGLHEIFIMSPFVSNDVIKYFNNRSRYINHSEHMLITRAMSLARLTPSDYSSFRIFTMKDAVAFGESAISEGEDSVVVQKQDIHAKVYLIRKDSNTELYLGSLNASHNAVYGNVEFMICLYSKNRYLNMEKLTKGLFCGEAGGPDNPFEEITLESTVGFEEEDRQNLLDGIVKRINRMKPFAEITQQGDLYDVSLTFAEKGEDYIGYDISISPLLANKKQPFAEEILFTSLNITDLSEFYVVEVSDGNKTVSRIIKIATTGMPEGREKEVIASVVNDRACFYRYIAFLLGDSFVLSALESGAASKSGSSKRYGVDSSIPAIYEKMLQTAATAPERFKEIDYLIKSISKDGIVPEYFEELYETFRKVVKI